jgi:hypothetical protein
MSLIAIKDIPRGAIGSLRRAAPPHDCVRGGGLRQIVEIIRQKHGRQSREKGAPPAAPYRALQ